MNTNYSPVKLELQNDQKFDKEEPTGRGHAWMDFFNGGLKYRF